jgi:hypothetical protein
MATKMTSKVLLENGFYKPIHNVLVGDKLMGMRGEPITVKKIHIHKNEKRDLIVNIKHDNWHETVPLKSDSEVLVWNRNKRTPYWIQSEFYTEEQEQMLIMPLNMKWTIPNETQIKIDEKTSTSTSRMPIKPSYHLGFIFGAYMKIGNIVDDTVTFHCDTTSIETIRTLCNYMKKVFGDIIKEHKTTTTYYHDVFYTDSTNFVKNIFLKFKIGDKKFPVEYLCDDFEYIKGIHFGMMLTGRNSHHNFESISVKELTYWTSYVLGKPAQFGQVKFHNEGVNVLATRSSLFGLERTKVNFVSLEVDGNDDAYIVGNMLVRPM